MKLSVNDQEVVTGARSIEALVGEICGAEAAGVAVAVDGKIIPRGRWAETPLREGVRVMIIRATQGG